MLKKIENFSKKVFQTLFEQSSYKSDLESYIVSRNPQCPGDIERLTMEYGHRTKGAWL